MSFQQNFAKSSSFVVKLLFSVVLWLDISEISLKVPLNSLFRPHFVFLFLKFQKKTSNFTGFMQLGEVSGEISLKSAQVSLIIHHSMGKIEVLLCMYVSLQG